MLMDVREGEGLSGVPALNCRGERSAECTSAVIPQLSGESLRLSSGYLFLDRGV
jgi:hypothetical protein